MHLAGDVDLSYEADAAYETVADLVGVVDVAMEVRVTSAVAEARCLVDRVSFALRAHHGLVSSDVSVRVWRAEVTLTGTMSSLEEHDRALATV